MTTDYFDGLASEVQDLLEDRGMARLSDLTAHYGLNSELMLSVITARMGTIVRGKLEAGLLYTSGYLRNLKVKLALAAV